VRRMPADAAAGTRCGSAVAAPVHDAMLFDSSTRAEPQEGGGYRLTGTKIFTSLAPVWDRLVVHGRLAEAPGTDPRLVFGIIARTAEVETLDDWDTHGMRPSQSRTTRLHAAAIPGDRVLTHTPVGPNPDPFVMGVFGAFELLIASV